MKIKFFEKDPEKTIKIDPKLYEEIEFMVSNSEEYENIENFIENAIKYKINRIKYNIENYDLVVSKEGLLIAGKEKSFTKCLVCDKLFLNTAYRNKEGKRICPRCSKIIRYFAERV